MFPPNSFTKFLSKLQSPVWFITIREAMPWTVSARKFVPIVPMVWFVSTHLFALMLWLGSIHQFESMLQPI